MSDCKWLLENKTQYHNYKLHHYDARNGYFIQLHSWTGSYKAEQQDYCKLSMETEF